MHAWVRPNKASHSHKMWTEVFSSVPHFLHMGSLHSPMICKCLLKVLCPVSRPITTPYCVLLKNNSRAPIARSGPEINSRAYLHVLQGPRHNACLHVLQGPCHNACLHVLQGPCHNARCCFSIQCFIFLIFCLKTPKKGSGLTNRWKELSFVSLLAISFPLTPACPATWKTYAASWTVNLGTRLMSVNFMNRKKLSYPLDRRIDRP